LWIANLGADLFPAALVRATGRRSNGGVSPPSVVRDEKGGSHKGGIEKRVAEFTRFEWQRTRIDSNQRVRKPGGGGNKKCFRKTIDPIPRTRIVEVARPNRQRLNGKKTHMKGGNNHAGEIGESRKKKEGGKYRYSRKGRHLKGERT